MEVVIEFKPPISHFAGRPDFDKAVEGLRVKAMASEWENGILVEGSKDCYRVTGLDLFKAIQATGNIHRIKRNQIPALLTLRPSQCHVVTWYDNNPGKS
jgi:hypothetical protein